MDVFGASDTPNCRPYGCSVHVFPVAVGIFKGALRHGFVYIQLVSVYLKV